MHTRRILAIVSLFLLYSCSPQWHIERADKHVEKAEKKGAVITNDTTYVFGDTIVNTYWKDSVLYVVKTVTNEVFVEGEIRYITKKDKRILRRKEKRQEKREFKIKKKELNVEKKQAKAWNKFWLGFVIGSALTFILMILIKKYMSKIKSLLS